MDRKRGTLAEALCHCEELDWAGKEQSQAENARRLVAFLGPNMRCSDVTEEVLDGIVLHLKAASRSNATIKHYLSAMGVLLKRAQRLRYIKELPLFPEARTLRSAEPRDLVLKQEWFEALTAELRDPQRFVARKGDAQKAELRALLVEFLWLMGCRVSEALNLTWDRVSFEHRTISFIKTKASNPRRLPMSPEVEAILLRVRVLADGPGPFPISYKTLHPHYMAAVDRVCFALGLGATVRKEWCIHTLRHSCLTMLAAAGASGPQIMQWAGHKSLSMTQRYVHGSAIDLTAVSQLRSTTPAESVAPVKPFPARDLAL